MRREGDLDALWSLSWKTLASHGKEFLQKLTKETLKGDPKVSFSPSPKRKPPHFQINESKRMSKNQRSHVSYLENCRLGHSPCCLAMQTSGLLTETSVKTWMDLVRWKGGTSFCS